MKYLARIVAVTVLLSPVGSVLAAKPAPSPAPTASAAAKSSPAKSRAVAFHGPIDSVDKVAKTVTIGKKKLREIHITAQTKLLKGDGKTPATWNDLVKGAEARGSYKKSEKGELEAVTFKVGPKS